MLFFHDYLLVIESTVKTFLLVFQLFLVVRYNLEFLSQVRRGRTVVEQLYLFRFVFGQKINVLHLLEETVGDYTGRIIESHPSGI